MTENSVVSCPYDSSFLSSLNIDAHLLLANLVNSPHWWFPTAYNRPTKRAQMYVSDVADTIGNAKLKPGMAYYNTHATVRWNSVPFELSAIRQELNLRYSCDFTFLSLLRYDSEDIIIGPHQDQKDEGDWTFPIATISLGAEREFWWASIDDYKKENKRLRGEYVKQDYARSTAKTKAKAKVIRNIGLTLKPKSGSLLVMPAGFQESHLHAVLKSDKPCERRISLTFRVYPKTLTKSTLEAA